MRDSRMMESKGRSLCDTIHREERWFGRSRRFACSRKGSGERGVSSAFDQLSRVSVMGFASFALCDSVLTMSERKVVSIKPPHKQCA